MAVVEFHVSIGESISCDLGRCHEDFRKDMRTMTEKEITPDSVDLIFTDRPGL